MGDYQKYPEGRPVFLPESERYGNPPDLPSLLLQQRVIYISMPVRDSMLYQPFYMGLSLLFMSLASHGM